MHCQINVRVSHQFSSIISKYNFHLIDANINKNVRVFFYWLRPMGFELINFHQIKCKSTNVSNENEIKKTKKKKLKCSTRQHCTIPVTLSLFLLHFRYSLQIFHFIFEKRFDVETSNENGIKYEDIAILKKK